jgi:hypothetical protein
MTPAHYRYMALIDLRLRAEMQMCALNLTCSENSPKNSLEKSRYLRLNLFNEIVDHLLFKYRAR